MFTFPFSLLSFVVQAATDFMPYTVITATTDVQLAKNNGYLLSLSSSTASVILKLPLSGTLTAGDRIEFYPSLGKAKIQPNAGDTGFVYKDPTQTAPRTISEIQLDNNNILIGLIWTGSAIGWIPTFKYDLPYTAGIPDTSYVASQMPGVPTSQRSAVATAAFNAATAIGGATTQYSIIDAMVARVFNWLPFATGKVYTDSAGTTLATTSGDLIRRADPWIGSLKVTSSSDSVRPTLSTSGAVFGSGGATYLIADTATFALPAQTIVFKKANANFANYEGLNAIRTSVPGGFTASNEDYYVDGDSGTNSIYDAGLFTSHEVNGVSTYALNSATGLNNFYSTRSSASGSKSAVLGTDTNDPTNRYLRGSIADVLWYNAALSTTEKTNINAFLKSFWSIP